MMCQAEMESHWYHCQLELNLPLPGEGELWSPQQKFFLEVEDSMLGFTSLNCHSLHT